MIEFIINFFLFLGLFVALYEGFVVHDRADELDKEIEKLIEKWKKEKRINELKPYPEIIKTLNYEFNKSSIINYLQDECKNYKGKRGFFGNSIDELEVQIDCRNSNILESTKELLGYTDLETWSEAVFFLPYESIKWKTNYKRLGYPDDFEKVFKLKLGDEVIIRELDEFRFSNKTKIIKTMYLGYTSGTLDDNKVILGDNLYELNYLFRYCQIYNKELDKWISIGIIED